MTVVVLACCALCTPMVRAGQPKLIEVLAIGATIAPATQIVSWLTDEPLTSVSQVPTRGFGEVLSPEAYTRFVRLYLPRNYDAMLQYDLFIYVGGCVEFITPTQTALLKSVVVEGGKGALADLGGVSTEVNLIETWINSGIWEIFPSDAVGVYASGDWWRAQRPFTIRLLSDRENDPLEPFLPLGVEKIVGNYGRLIIPQPGSTIYATMAGIVFLGYDEPPFLVAWDHGKGRTMLVAEFFNWQWFRSPAEGGQNEYSLDIVLNMLMNVLDRPVFQDVLLLHNARLRIGEYHQRYVMLISVLDFVEGFGANTGPIRGDLEEIQGLFDQAKAEYLQQNLEASISAMDAIIQRMALISGDAFALKDRALLWVYTIEWLAVSGTVMASGTLLYTVMLRRRMFREPRTTRFVER